MTRPQLSVKWDVNAVNVLMFAAQIAAVVWFIAGQEARIEANTLALNDAKTRSLENRTNIVAATQAARSIELRQSVSETKLENIGATVARIERLVEALYNERRADPPQRQ